MIKETKTYSYANAYDSIDYSYLQIISYDSKGRIIKESRHTPFNLEWYYSHEFVNKDLEICWLIYGNSNDTVKKYVSTYKNSVIRKKDIFNLSLNKNDTISKSTKYFYNDFGQLELELKEQYGRKYWRHINVNKFDGEHKLILKQYFNTDSILIGFEEYKYSDSRLKLVNSYKAGHSNPYTIQKYFYTGDLLYSIKKFEAGSEEVIRGIEYIYNEHGQLMEEEHKENGHLRLRNCYKYDACDRLIQKIRYDYEFNWKYVSEYIYWK